MTLQQMRYFIGAAESGSISEAAKRSLLPSPAFPAL